MTQVTWDQVGQRLYETGVDRGVLYIPDSNGVYDSGFAWNGLVSVTESPSGAESNPQYADNIKYLNLQSYEEFGATIEAFTYPVEFGQCDGTASPQEGVSIGQQARKTFGLSYRTRLGNDLLGVDYGYKVHLIYGALAAPSEKAYTTINDSPEAITFSWEVTTIPVPVTDLKPAAYLCVDSTKVDADALAALEELLYGTVGTDPSLPSPDDVLALFDGTVLTATPTAPTYDAGTDNITIPSVTGVVYKINGSVVTGTVHITASTVVTAHPATGYVFTVPSVDRWLITFA